MATIKQIYDDEEDNRASSGSAESAPLTGPGSSSSARALPAEKSAYTQSNFVSGKAILDKNRGMQTAPNFTADYQNKIGEQAQAGKESYEKYLQDANNAAKKATFNPKDVQSAIWRNDPKATEKLNWILGSKLPSMIPGKENVTTFGIQAYKPYEPNLDVQEANALLSGAGVQDAFTRKQQEAGNFGYTQGQAALDSVLFGKNPLSINMVQDALSKRKELYDQGAKDAKSAKSVQTSGNHKISKSVGDLRKLLTDEGAKIESQAKELTSSKNNKPEISKADEKALAAYVSQKTQEMIQDPKNRALFEANPDLLQNFQKGVAAEFSGQKGNRFITPGSYSGPTYTNDTAQAFNNIASMLGYPSTVLAGGKLGAGTLDKQTIDDILAVQLGVSKFDRSPPPTLSGDKGSFIDRVPVQKTPPKSLSPQEERRQSDGYEKIQDILSKRPKKQSA